MSLEAPYVQGPPDEAPEHCNDLESDCTGESPTCTCGCFECRLARELDAYDWNDGPEYDQDAHDAFMEEYNR